MRPVLLEIRGHHGQDIGWLRAESTPHRALINLAHIRTITATAHGEALIELAPDQPPFLTVGESVAALAARIEAAPRDALLIALPVEVAV